MEDALDDNLATRAFFDIRKSVFVMGTRTKTIQKRIKDDDPTLIALSSLIPKYTGPVIEHGKEQEKIFKEILDKLIDHHVIENTTDALAEFRARLNSVAKMLDADAPCEDFVTDDTDADL